MDNVTLFVYLLSGDYFFFNDDDIVWDGMRHSITGIQVNAPQADQLQRIAVNTGYDGIEELANYLIAVMSELEKDEGLRVPRGLIAPNIRKEICEGDLTGITFMNLATRSQSLAMNLTEDDAYTFAYDMRLARGIPSFFDLAARWIWDLRDCFASLRNLPFTITWASCRNLDVETRYGLVDEPVAGAQVFPLVTQVTSCPEIRLP